MGLNPRSIAVDLTDVDPGISIPVTSPAVVTTSPTVAFAAAALAAGVVLVAAANASREYLTGFNNTDVDLLVKLVDAGGPAPAITASDFQDKVPPQSALYLQKGEHQQVYATAPGATTGQLLVTEENS